MLLLDLVHLDTPAAPMTETNGTLPQTIGDAEGAFALLAAALADAVLVLDVEGTVTFCSDHIHSVLGIGPDALVGERLIEHVHPEDREGIPKGTWWRAVPADREFRMRAADGRWRWMSAATSAADPDGNRRALVSEALGEGSLILLRDLPTGPEVRDRVDLYRRALDAVNNLVVVTDSRLPDNPIVFANQSFLRDTGYEREEVIGENCRFLQDRPDGSRDDEQEGLSQLRTAIRRGTGARSLLRNYRKDGTLFHNELFISPLRTGGQLAGFVGVQNDVTELVESEQKATDHGHLLEAFYNSAPFAMGVVELDEGRACHKTANSLAIQLFDLEELDVSGQRSQDLGFTDEEAQRWDDALRRCRTAGGPVRFETTFPWGADSSDEKARHLNVVVNAAEGDGPFFSYVAEDVTERRAVEEERLLLQQAVESFSEGVLITGAALDEPGPLITYANAAIHKMTGYDVGELTGETPRIFQGPKTDRALLDRLRRQLEAGERFSGESVNYRKDGSDYLLDWEVVPIYDQNGTITHWVSTQRDVTDRRRLEQEVLEVGAREQERIARDLHDGLGQTIAAASMLCATWMEDLREEGHPSADMATRIHTMLREAVQEARALAHGLHPVNVQSDGIMKALTHLTETAGAAYGVECTFACEEPVLMRDHDRALHVYRIVQEAIANAVRHGRAERITVTLDAAADQDPEVPHGFIALSVQDDGSGISSEAFLRNDGLGLRSMRYRADRIGGQIEVQALEGGGTLVYLLFDPKGAMKPAL